MLLHCLSFTDEYWTTSMTQLFLYCRFLVLKTPFFLARMTLQMRKVKDPKISKAWLVIKEYNSKMNSCAQSAIENLHRKTVTRVTCVPTRGSSSFGATIVKKGFKIKTIMTDTWADMRGEPFLVSIVLNDLPMNISWSIICPNIRVSLTTRANYVDKDSIAKHKCKNIKTSTKDCHSSVEIVVESFLLPVSVIITKNLVHSNESYPLENALVQWCISCSVLGLGSSLCSLYWASKGIKDYYFE